MAHQFDEAYDDVWRHERLITLIQQKAGISWAKAENAARATLTTLAARISAGEARDVAEDLPQELRRRLLDAATPKAEPFDRIEFIRRVSEREGVDTDTAEQHARAVFVALARLVRRDELRGVLAELSKDYEPLLAEAVQRSRIPRRPRCCPTRRSSSACRGVPGWTPSPPSARSRPSSRRSPSGSPAARSTTSPSTCRRSCARRWGAASARPAARPRPCRSTSSSPASPSARACRGEAALDHAHAVFETLREALPDKELSDLLAQLPRGYAEALL